MRDSFATTRNHWWWRPGWGPGTRYYTFHLTFEQAPELHAEAARWGPALAAIEYVDPVPERWLHLTMTGVGHVAEVDPDQLGRIADGVFEGLGRIETAPLVLDRTQVVLESLALTAHTPPWLDQLHRLQHEVVSMVLTGEPGPVPEPLWAHVSLAYFSGEIGVDGLRDLVTAVGPRAVTVARPMVSLLELGRDERVYTWRVVDQRPI